MNKNQKIAVGVVTTYVGVVLYKRAQRKRLLNDVAEAIEITERVLNKVEQFYYDIEFNDIISEI